MKNLKCLFKSLYSMKFTVLTAIRVYNSYRCIYRVHRHSSQFLPKKLVRKIKFTLKIHIKNIKFTSQKVDNNSVCRPVL